MAVHRPYRHRWNLKVFCGFIGHNRLIYTLLMLQFRSSFLLAFVGKRGVEWELMRLVGELVSLMLEVFEARVLGGECYLGRWSPAYSIGGRHRVCHIQESSICDAPRQNRPRFRHERCLGLEHNVRLCWLWEGGRIVPLLLAVFDALVRQWTMCRLVLEGREGILFLELIWVVRMHDRLFLLFLFINFDGNLTLCSLR